MIAESLRWWLVIEAAGFVALPIALLLFRGLPGRGYGFSKPVGLLLIGYLFWLALSLHLLPNRPGSIFWVVLLLGAVDVYLLRRWGAELRATIEERVGLVVAVELVFALSLAAAVYLRSLVPEILATEKPMDFMLLNAVSRTRFLPPADPWLAGFDVSYYYFGYVIQGAIAKMAAAPTPVAFNLGLAGTAALTVTAAFGLGYEVVRLARWATFRAGLAVGGLAVVLVAVIGNLEGAVEFGVANGSLSRGAVERIDIGGLELARRSDFCLVVETPCLAVPDERSSFWWWWRATRISPDGNSITEFPFFSFLLGDLHPHVMALPFVLSVVALGLALWRSPEGLGWDTWRRRPALLLLCGVLVGGLGFLNTWDLPTLGFLVAMLVVARNLSGVAAADAARALKEAAGFLAPLAVLAAGLYAPFYLGFSSQASGLAPVTGEATRPLHSFLFWAPLLAVSLPWPLALLVADREAYRPVRIAIAASAPLALGLLWALLVLTGGGASLPDAIAERGANWLTTLFFGMGLVVCQLALVRLMGAGRTAAEADGSLVPVMILMTTALLLIFGAELFYIRDLFGSRLNSVFKLYYQAWLLLALSGAYGLFWQARRWPPSGQTAQLLRGVWSGVLALVLAAALLYPLGATLSRTDGLSRPGRTLDGLAYAGQSAQGEYALAAWLRRRAGPEERLVEGTGDAYTEAARVSAWSGVPSVLGWPGHEVQWGRDAGSIATRRADIDRAYTTASLAEALTILRKYDVAYIVVGSLETQKYPAAGLAKFATGLPVELFAGQAVLYRIPRMAAGLEAGR